MPPAPLLFWERDRASPPPGPMLSPPERCRRTPIPPGFFVSRAAPPVLVSAPSAGEVPSPEALFWGSGHPPWAILPFVAPLPLQPCAQKRWSPYWGLFVSGAAPPVLLWAPSAGEVAPPGTACFFERSARSPPFSLSCSPPVCPKTLAPVPWSFSVSRAAPSVLRSALSAVGGPPGAAGAFPPSDRRPFPAPSSPVPTSPFTGNRRVQQKFNSC